MKLDEETQKHIGAIMDAVIKKNQEPVLEEVRSVKNTLGDIRQEVENEKIARQGMQNRLQDITDELRVVKEKVDQGFKEPDAEAVAQVVIPRVVAAVGGTAEAVWKNPEFSLVILQR